MEKCAIIIGINDTPKLSYLTSACDYARKMDAWAKSQGFKTALFVDETESGAKIRVRVEDILDAAVELLIGNPEQVLVYFAGHGMERTAGNEVWLLPEYDHLPNQSIDLDASRHLAAESGADHVIFISDTCRIPKDNKHARHVNGGFIFPSMGRTNYNVVVDTLFSTWPGEPSIDYRDEDGNYRSIYSDCLLDCLQGDVEEVIREIHHPAELSKFPAVICQELSRYLKKTVPIVTLQKTLNSQHPSSNVTSTEPIYISRFNKEDASEYKSIDEEIYEDLPHTFQTEETIEQKLEHISRWKTKRPFELGVSGTLRLIQSINNRLLGDNNLPRDKTGIVFNGRIFPEIYSIGGEQIYLKSWMPDARTDNLIDLSDQFQSYSTVMVSNITTSGFYPITILPNFVASLIFSRGELISIDYIPTTGFRRDEAIYYRQEIAKRKAEIITAAKNGIFQGSEELASYVRKYKGLDPTLGLFASYAYFQSGKFEDVRSVYDYMRREDEPVLPEVQLLSYLSGQKELIGKLNIGEPILPMLTQGWSYLGLLDRHISTELQSFLRPGLWTSLNRSGLQKLHSLVNNSRVR